MSIVPVPRGPWWVTPYRRVAASPCDSLGDATSNV